MSRERLSKLQKWILREGARSKSFSLSRDRIFEGFYGWEKEPRYFKRMMPVYQGDYATDEANYKLRAGAVVTVNDENLRFRLASIGGYLEYHKAQVTVSRSLKNMEAKGLVEVDGKRIRLTRKGWEKGQELLIVDTLT